MGKKSIKVIHIDSEKGWRGGQQQAAYLFENMHLKGYTTLMVCQPASKFSNYCQDKKLPFKEIRMQGEIDFIAGYKISQIARNEGYQILHAHSAHALSTALWAKFFYRKLKIIGVRRVDFHLKRNLFSRFKYQTKMVDNIVCISNGIKKVLLEDGISNDKLITIHSGINIHKFDKIEPFVNFRKEFNIPKNHVIIGTVAALVGHKDYPNLLQAAKQVVQTNPNVTFVSLGSGKNEEQIKSLHKELELGDSFRLLGFRTDVGAIMKHFDIFVMASKLEGLGTSILDAQSIGLPVIGTDTGGIPEAVHHQTNGILVPPSNPEKLTEAILYLIENKEVRIKMRKNAFDSVKEFDVQETIRKNLALYKKLLD